MTKDLIDPIPQPKFIGRALEPDEIKLLEVIMKQSKQCGDYAGATLMERVIESAKYAEATLQLRKDQRDVAHQEIAKLKREYADLVTLTHSVRPQEFSLGVDYGTEGKTTAVLIERKEDGVLKIIDIFQK